MLRKQDLYNRAIALRERGYSYTEILESIPVAQSTISRWCSAVPLTQEQQDRLNYKRDNNPFIQLARERSVKTEEKAKFWVQDKLRGLSDRELLTLSGILLYWAEGTKRGTCCSAIFTNTDSDMIKIMMRFFREILHIPENKFKVKIRIGEKGNIEVAEIFWSKITNVPKQNFRKPEILKLKKKSTSLDKYPYGICRITIDDVLVRKKILIFIKDISALLLKEKKLRNNVKLQFLPL